ncbi:MAG: hypothetical protein Kow00129_14440 [Thermoleophilia bacterium]
MKKLAIIGILALGMVTLLSALAFSAPPTSTSDVTISAQVPQRVGLTLTKNTISLVTDPETQPTDTDSLDATIKSNWNWTLDISAVSLQGTAPDNSTVTLDPTLLQITDGTNNFDANGTTLTGAPGSETRTFDYTLTIDWTTPPADYSGTQTWTLTYQ